MCEQDDWLDAAVTAGSYTANCWRACTVNAVVDLQCRHIRDAGIGENDWTSEFAEIQLTMDNDDGSTDIWGFTWEQTNRIYQLQPLAEGLGGDAIGEDGLTVTASSTRKPGSTASALIRICSMFTLTNRSDRAAGDALVPGT